MRTAAEKADLSLYDQLESNEAEETIYRLMLTVTAMLSVCIAAMGVMGLLNAAAGRVHSRRRDLSVLRSVGMTGAKSCACWCTRGCSAACWPRSSEPEGICF